LVGPIIDAADIVKDYGSARALHGVSLEVGAGEFLALVGPSGCGKTTLLKILAGFEEPTGGRLEIQGKDMRGVPAANRPTRMVFQKLALFPHKTVAENIGFPLKLQKVEKSESDSRVRAMLDLMHLKPEYLDRFPFELSGGQQQRVALARALAPSPRMLLLDEPLSALDAKIRVSLREQIREIQRELGITTIFVTHDQEEALSISDRIVVMNAGHVEQMGQPFEIYNRPATKFVATFVGQLNTLNATVSDAQAKTVSIDGQSAAVPSLPASARSGEAIALTMRPEAVRLGAREGDIALNGKVVEVAFLGSVIRLKVDLGGNRIDLDTFNDRATPPPALGSPVTVGIAASDILVLG